MEYFKLANAIVAFHVVQTPIFLLTVYRNPDLLASLTGARWSYIWGSFVIAAVYAAVLLACGCMEGSLWSDKTLARQAHLAAAGRIAVVLFQAVACAVVLHVMKKPVGPEAKPAL
jgi:hypothetical protein